MKMLSKILKKQITSTIIALLFGFLVAAIVLAIAGYNPGQAFGALFKGMLSKPKYISNVIIKATPIILTGLSVAFAFKTGLFNIGAEGQYVAGSIAAVLVGVKLNLPAVIQVPLVVLAGVLGGMVFGSVVGFFESKVRNPRSYHQHYAELDFPIPVKLYCEFAGLPSAEFHKYLSGQ
jgi:nucleoside ABC transporter membrane protein